MKTTVKLIIFSAFVALALISSTACRATQNATGANREHIEEEGTVIVARPEKYFIFFGSYSIGEYLDITYDRLTRNQAGQTGIEVGIRYKGALRWYNFLNRSPEYVTLYVRADFYQGTRIGKAYGPPIYSTNRQIVHIRLGDTFNFKAVCPDVRGQSCQIFISE